MKTQTFILKATDGAEIFVYKWLPDHEEPRACVQIAHGMQEHAGRYERLAKSLTEVGYGVWANDHRGHGRTGDGGHLGVGGWQRIVDDLVQLGELIDSQNVGVPRFILGHSWGSFLTQAYIQEKGQLLKGVILSGTNGTAPVLELGVRLAKTVAFVRGSDTRAFLLKAITVGPFSNAFPTEGENAWLSRDHAEVNKFANDPKCGQDFPNSFFVQLLCLLRHIWSAQNEAKIPKELPFYLLAGADDPVGHKTRGIKKLIDRYQKLKIEDLSYRFYEGGRHEMFNEINRQEVTVELIDWLDSKNR